MVRLFHLYGTKAFPVALSRTGIKHEGPWLPTTLRLP